jgi:hypothetical protein
MSTLEDKLLTYAKNNLNVMIIGTHGIGKSTVVKAIAEKLGMKFKYYSSSTLDPYSELIGVPVPNKERKSLDFYRPDDLGNAEFVFFDELNRVQNPRILNAVLEIVQFKSINGEPLKNLKMVWCAINPPGDYQVEDLDPALVDRFHIYITMKASIDMEYMKSKMSEKVAKVVKDWWETDLSDEQRKILTPRRVEYLGCMIDNNIPWRDAIPVGHTFPVNQLDKRIDQMITGEDELVLSKDNVLSKVEEFIGKLDKDPRIAIGLSSVIAKFNEDELFKCRNLIEKLPTELVNKVIENKFITRQRTLRDLFVDAHIDIVKDYPKICKSFKQGVV